jgi:hypothetical protein
VEEDVVRPLSNPAGPEPDSSIRFGSDAGPALREFSMVALRADIALPDHRVMPSGSRGAIVFVYENGAAYEVEFSRPFHALLTIEASLLDEA